MATKKQAQPADLPTKTKSTYVRPSRYKAAIAEREAAKLDKVIDAITLVDATTGMPVTTVLTDTDFAMPSETDDCPLIVSVYADGRVKLLAHPDPLALRVGQFDALDTDTGDIMLSSSSATALRDFLFDAEITASVAALDESNGLDHPEVIRSLADLGLGDDPLLEEEAFRRLAGKPSIADEFADQVSESTWDFMQDADDRAAVDIRLKTAQAVKLEMDNAQRQPPQTISDEDYETMVYQYDQIRELELANASLTGRQTADEKTIAHLDIKLQDYKDDLDRTIKSLNVERDECNEVKRLLATRSTEVERLAGEVKAVADARAAVAKIYCDHTASAGVTIPNCKIVWLDRVGAGPDEQTADNQTIADLVDELDALKSRGVFARLFGKGAR